MEKTLLDKIEHFTCTRSFSQKVQVRQYEPVDYFSSYTAIIRPEATEEEIQSISDSLAEKAEDDVMSKIDPTKTVSRRVSMAELRTKLAQQEKRIKELETAKLQESAF